MSDDVTQLSLPFCLRFIGTGTVCDCKPDADFASSVICHWHRQAWVLTLWAPSHVWLWPPQAWP